ncbi:MAG: hypothetical protein VX498_07655, partial [Myxococcota bacterium]|nr:hypothetical protein [Myxococcota bacterium]
MRFGLLLCSVLLLPASAASAVERSPYFTEREDLVFDLEEIDYDSDWQPADSPIQVRFVVHSGNSIYVGMDGDGTYNWDAGQIYFDGYDDGGAFDIDIGVDIQSQVRFDILGNQWESDELQLLAWGIFETVLFDPYLLAGSPYRPAYIETEIPPETVLDIPLGIDL